MKHNKKRILLPIIIIALAVIATLCGWYFLSEWKQAKEEVREYEEIKDAYTTTVSNRTENESRSIHSEIAGLPYVSVDFGALLAINPETVGWVAIPDSVISYPVMQASNNWKYLKTSSNGTKSGAGAVFMDMNNAPDSLDTNTILYGHNMGRGRTDIFGTLLYYNEEEYYETHKFIQFDTIHELHGWWKIFAVINMDIKSGEFNYLRLDFQDDADFTNWIDQAQALSLYDTGVPVEPGDKILTLSTCDGSNYGKSGRQLIMAVHYGF